MDTLDKDRPLMKVLVTLYERTFVRLREAIRKRVKTRYDDGKWVTGLDRVGEDLDVLSQSTETEFLSIGEKLQGFYVSAREISKISSSVAGLMSGEDIRGVIVGFRDIFERIEKLEGESRQSAGTLKQVLGILDHMYEHLTGFQQTARVLRVLCVCTRIESARLGQRDIGFSILAGDVDKLAGEIESKCSHLMEHSVSLSELIRRTLSKVLVIEAKQQGQARVILDSTMSSLTSLTEKHGASSGGVKQISARYEAISRSIGEIVASLQFHDITRQRIEHAKKAVDVLIHEKKQLEANGSRRPADEGLQHLRMAGDICELQVAQFRDARDELTSAVNNIIGNLHRIASNVTDIAEETQKMAGAADELGRSFLSEVEAGVSSLTSALSGYSQSSGELASAMGSLGSNLSDMSVYATDIEGIGTKIKLIALNAIVKSCHIGEEGAALGVLAEGIHNLSVETCHRTATVCESFKSIMTAAEALNIGVDTERGGKAVEVNQLAEMLEASLNTLQSVNTNIVSLLTRMDVEGRTLSDNIERTIAGIGVHRHVEDVIGEVVAQLNEVVSLSRSLIPISSQLDREDHLRAMEASYTMQGERKVHQSVVTVIAPPEEIEMKKTTTLPFRESEALDAPKPEGKTEGEGKDKDDEDLGDNVELF